MSQEIMRALGRIEGQLVGIKGQQAAHGKKLGGIDDRLRSVESKAAQHGLLAGGVAGVGIMLITESLKSVFKSNGA